MRKISKLTLVTLSAMAVAPGAEQLVRVLKRLGYRLAVISGGFLEVVEPIRQRLGLADPQQRAAGDHVVA